MRNASSATSARAPAICHGWKSRGTAILPGTSASRKYPAIFCKRRMRCTRRAECNARSPPSTSARRARMFIDPSARIENRDERRAATAQRDASRSTARQRPHTARRAHQLRKVTQPRERPRQNRACAGNRASRYRSVSLIPEQNQPFRSSASAHLLGPNVDLRCMGC